MGRDKVLADIGPKHSNTNLINTSRVESRRLTTGFKKTKGDNRLQPELYRSLSQNKWKKLKTLKCVPPIDEGIKVKFFFGIKSRNPKQYFPFSLQKIIEVYLNLIHKIADHKKERYEEWPVYPPVFLFL